MGRLRRRLRLPRRGEEEAAPEEEEESEGVDVFGFDSLLDSPAGEEEGNRVDGRKVRTA